MRPEQGERLGMAGRIGQLAAAKQLDEPGIAAAGGAQRVQHRQRPYPLSQVRTWSLARLRRVAGYVEDVIGKLERHAERLAGGPDPLDDLSGVPENMAPN